MKGLNVAGVERYLAARYRWHPFREQLEPMRVGDHVEVKGKRYVCVNVTRRDDCSLNYELKELPA